MKKSNHIPDSIEANQKVTHILWFLLFMTVLVLFGLSFVDQSWTLWLRENGNRWWGLMMHRSLFRGEGIGGSDLLPFVWMFSLFFYVRSHKKELKPHTKSRLDMLRPVLGYLVVTPLVGMAMVHCLKWSIGRARPHEVWGGKWPFTTWNEFGAHFINEGTYSGSFPSGHTGSVVILISLFYVIQALKRDQFLHDVLQWFTALLVLSWSVGMALGRAITADHWLTDSLGVIFPLWALVHALYYHVLKIPQQLEYQRLNGVPPVFPTYWELKIAGQSIMIGLGCILIIWWIRCFQLEVEFWYYGILIPGIMLTSFFGHYMQKLYRQGMIAIFETHPSQQ